MEYKPLKRELSWSWSRVDIFTRCRLEYYYTYYASWGGWERDTDTFTRTLYVLKNIKNRYAWMGDMVHQIIQQFLAAFLSGRTIDKENLLKMADHTMRNQFVESRNREYWERPNKANGLVEHENNIPVPDEKWKELHGNVLICASNFFYTDFYKNVIEKGITDIFRMEKLENFKIDNIKVYAKPDVALKEQGQLKIFDWKTGRPDDENEAQLYYYILYGIHKLKFNPEAIGATIVYLRDNTKKEITVDQAHLDNAVAYIKDTYAEMKECDLPYEENRDGGDIPQAKSESTCNYCRFRTVCPRWRKD
jgi:CRISPR/Cas system-associated exonuclease Cas4 (RecB family)